MILPPRPRAPAMRPPQKEKNTSFIRVPWPSRFTSQSPNSTPAEIFKFYSALSDAIEYLEITIQIARKTTSIAQPPQEHLSIPIMLGIVLDPLNKLTKPSNMKTRMLSPYLFGCQCVFSYSTNWLYFSNACFASCETIYSFCSSLFSSTGSRASFSSFYTYSLSPASPAADSD